MFCYKCGSNNNEQAEYCTSCGNYLVSQGPTDKCPSCEALVPLSGRFCTECGYEAHENIAAVQAQRAVYIRYASFFDRVLAVIIDTAVLFTVNFVIGLILQVILMPEDIIIFIFGLITGIMYYVFLESSEYQGTLGKQALKLKVTDIDGNRISGITAFLRHCSKFLSAIICGMGFLLPIIDEKNQALHDKLVYTLVVKKQR